MTLHLRIWLLLGRRALAPTLWRRSGLHTRVLHGRLRRRGNVLLLVNGLGRLVSLGLLLVNGSDGGTSHVAELVLLIHLEAELGEMSVGGILAMAIETQTEGNGGDHEEDPESLHQ